MKAGFWLRGARGKINDTVLRKGKRHTIQSEYKAPKNPQTAMQMAQRIIFATVAGAAKYMKPIVDHSFEGITDKQESLNHFKKINIARLRSFAADDFANQPAAKDAKCFLTTKGISALIPNLYTISDGSLDYKGSIDIADEDDFLCYSQNGDSIPLTNGKFSPLALITFLFGLSTSSQQFTWCQITGGNDTLYCYQGQNGVGEIINNARFNYGRLVLSEAAIQSDAPYSFTNSQALVDKLKTYFDTNKSSAYLVDTLIDNMIFSVEDDVLTIELNEYQLNDALAAAIIFSELNNGKWLRSKATLKIKNPGNSEVLYNFGLYYGIAIDAWFTKDQIAESDAFLSQGGSAGGNFQ